MPPAMSSCSYSGWRAPLGDADRAIETLITAEVEPRRFWDDYVVKRKPVLLQGHLPDASWRVGEKWTDAYLTERAGACEVQVEVREGADASFGHGVKQPMPFKDFLARTQQGDDSLYLTTQKVPSAADGHPALWGPPLSALKDDFPLQPSLTGHLVPQQMNLWMGCARSGSSSGLHHDFHDNLYVLLRGRKRFRLWDPSHATAMHTAGKVKTVHSNGRIVYEGQEDVRADGSSVREAAAWEARTAAEDRVARAEEAVRKNVPGSAAELSAAEHFLEQLLEAQLEAAITGTGAQGPGALDDMQDDYVEEEDEAEEDEDEDMEPSDDDDGPDEDVGRSRSGAARRGLGDPPAKRKQTAGGAKAPNGKEAKGKKQKEEGVEPDPPSFCPGVDMSLSDSALRKRLPGFPGHTAMLEVWVEAGQMLYLPAGWFHEVTSFSAAADASGPAAPATAGASTRSKQRKEQARDSGGSQGAGSHAAFNYWFHPPDGKSFDKPYKSDYWPSLWRARCEAMGVSTSHPDSHPATAAVEQPAAQQQAPAPAAASQKPLQSALVRRSSFELAKVDELDGGTGHDPHRGPSHCFEGVRVDEVEGATGHDPHRGPRHSFDGVKVDEIDGGTGHDPHRGPRHSFDGVKVDEIEVGKGHHEVKPDNGAAVAMTAAVVSLDPGFTASVAAQAQPVVTAAVAAAVAPMVGRRAGRKGAAPKRLAPDAPHPATDGAPEQAETEAAASEPQSVQAEGSRQQKKQRRQTAEGGGGGVSAAGEPHSHGKAGRKAAAAAVEAQDRDEEMAEAEQEGEEADEEAGECEGEGEGEGEGEDVLEGDEGELGEMVAKELGSYFQSEEGSGAFRLALREYLIKALASGGLGEDGEALPKRPRRRSVRSRGRRHHRVVRVPKE